MASFETSTHRQQWILTEAAIAEARTAALATGAAHIKVSRAPSASHLTIGSRSTVG